MHHITQAKRKLRQLLLDRLPIELSNADMIAADGVSTPGPYEIHTTDKVDLGGMPSLELIVTDSTPTSNSFAQIYRHRIVVGVSLGGDTEEALSVQLERYLWVLRKIARDTHVTPVEGTAPIDTGGEQYTPLQQRPETVESPFVKGAFLELFVTTVE